MLTQGLRPLVGFVIVLVFVGGCAGVPPAPEHVNQLPPESHSTSRGDPYDTDTGAGWRYNTDDSSAASEPAGSAGVVPASATMPLSSAPAGPAGETASAGEPEPDSGFQLSDLAPENIYKNIKELTGYGPNERIARALLDDGEALFRQGKYSESAEMFHSAAKRWPDSQLEEDARFLLGESYFFSDRYPKALDTYMELLKKHHNSRHLDTATKRLFAIGRYWEGLYEQDPHWPITPNLIDSKRPRFDTFGNAIKAYETISREDPRGPLADDAVMATATAYFNKGQYEDAAFYFDTLRRDHSNSEHQRKAYVLAVRAKLRIYQGAQYDRTPLDDADKIAAQALTQFGNELGPQREQLVQTRDRLVEEKAKRDWTMGQYYDRQANYRAARMYYRAAIEDYPLTEHARLARARLEEIRDKPDVPPERFKWMTDLFPSEE